MIFSLLVPILTFLPTKFLFILSLSSSTTSNATSASSNSSSKSSNASSISFSFISIIKILSSKPFFFASSSSFSTFSSTLLMKDWSFSFNFPSISTTILRFWVR
ncbi:103aa long hypothetical protein [Pyrococcus horikoshii OT3]|uniref:Uncharacterized protein n=1 Tax=Pyrococcus horikoshii (strain ATCC 700860 / DSM 12428 / JCM 9974 / NBRC 100139 / OT-3) TaxID=70601 RepID=O59333_PYRHO|nr:103aa long hypothetical protein [Pyrococcus horikoshii OT3]